LFVKTFHINLLVESLPPSVAVLEKALLSNLPDGANLLRWAVVGRESTDGKDVWLCEGAALVP
jgi:hypothetical protein